MNRTFRYLKFSVVGLIVIESLALAYFMRPIQDDYFNLQSVQKLGVLGYLEDTWNSHGGNMVQFLLHCLMILPTTQHFVFWNFSLFFILTEILVFLSVKALNIWLFESASNVTRLWVPLLSIAGFEGLFVPGFLGAYGFSLASLAHLWPVMALVLGLLANEKKRGGWPLALLLGLVAGNSNLGESGFGCTVWFFLFIAFQRVPRFEEKSGITKSLYFYFLGFGLFLGTFGIAVAPGFWIRATDQIGLPDSLNDFMKRFAKSFASFTVDGFTHPMIWLFLVLGLLFRISYPNLSSKIIHFRLRMLLIGAIVIWFSLIIGSTFGYPAWHQSMGMYILLLPLAFAFGLSVKINVSRKLLNIILIGTIFLMTFTFLRVGILGVERSLRWDRNLSVNSCRIMSNPNSNLLGAEIQYPPFGLGIDDINTWEWMRSKYVGWVRGIPDNKCLMH